MTPQIQGAPQSLNSKQLVDRLVRQHMRGHIGRISLALLCMVLVAVATGAMARIMEPVIDTVFTDKNADMLGPVALAVFVIFVVKGVGSYGQSVLMAQVGRRIIANLQSQMFTSQVAADLDAFHQLGSGRLVARFTYDAQQLYGALADAVTGMCKDGLTAIVLIAVMFHLDWRLALIAFFVFPLAMLPIVRLGRRMRKVSRSTQAEYGQLTGFLTQVFQGIRHVKAYNAETREAARADVLIWEVARLKQKASRIRSLSHPIMETLGGLAIVAIILYGGNQVIEGTRTTGSFFAFITALLLAYEPLKKLANLNATLQQGLAAAERVFATIDAKPKIAERPGAATLERVDGRIALEDVRFSYHADVPALEGVSLTAEIGQTVALVGPSGAGKSTVLNLIPRFYDADGGTVTIDGHDVREVTLHSLREQIALVSQEVTLFDQSVRDNIAYGRPDATTAEIEQAARDAGAHGFITDLTQGYDTVVGEHGVRLSGGQRQRLSIARAMLKNAPILLLDEATSALDTESERLVQEALQRLMVGRTTLVIAHRLSTVIHADTIFVLDRGRVVEQGSHDVLIRKGGLYGRLWTMQTTALNGADPGEEDRPLSAAGE